MNPLARRRLLASATISAAAVVAGLLVAPAVTAAAGGLILEPGGVFNTETAKPLLFKGTEADFTFGGTSSFTRSGGGAPFTVAITANQPPTPQDHTGEATVNFTDMGNGVGSDGPADAGVYAVSATGMAVGPAGGGNDTCPSCFKVEQGGAVGVSSVAPNSLQPGRKKNVSILGSNFERGTVVQFLFADGSVDPSVTADAAPTDDDTDSGTAVVDKITTSNELKRRLSVAAGAAPGARDVRVTDLDGRTAVCPGCFFVSGAALTSISNPSGVNDPAGALIAITFNGSNVTNGTPRLEFVGSPGSAARNDLTIRGQNVRDYTGTAVTADFDLRNAAPSPSGYQPVVEGSGGVINACDCRFTVTQRPERTPTLTSLDSSTATGIQKDLSQGQSKAFTVIGTNFSKGATLTFTKTGLTVTSVEFVSPERLVATISATPAAETGARDVTAVLTDTKKSNVCTGCLNVVASSATPTPTPSATPTSTISPSPGQCSSTAAQVRVNTKVINATGAASVTVTGAARNSTVELQGYSQNHEGTMTFEADPTQVDRTGTADANGSVTFNDLRPASNTRVRARQVNCPYGNNAVIEVRAQETLEARRNGTRSYVISGRSIPARPGGLIVSLYRIVGSPCPAGVEPKSCPGEKFVGQGRAVALGQAGEGLYSIRITFPSRDQNVRDEFVVKTGRDAQNAPGRSNTRSLLIN